MLFRNTLVGAATIGLIFTTSPSASAYKTFGSHRLTYGIVNQKYWIDGSASGQVSQIDTSFSRWNATSTPASWSKTSVKADSHIDIYKVSTVNIWWAKVDRYVSTTMIATPPTQNWWWAKIRLDGNWSNCFNKTGVIAHEIGHAMGLDHPPTTEALMREDIADTYITLPKADDINGINFLY